MSRIWRHIVMACAMLVSVPTFAWYDGDSFYPRLTREDWLTAQDKETLLDDMSHNADILVIDGVEYMTAYSPLELIRGKRRYYEMYDGLLSSWEGLNFTAFWGDRANKQSNPWKCRLQVVDDSLCLMEIKYIEWLRIHDSKAHKGRFDDTLAVPQDAIWLRMEEFTDCRFVDGRMFLPIVSGTVFAKQRNLAPRPKEWSSANKSPEDMRTYLRWVEEPVYRIVFEEGRMVSMEAMDEPITAEEHRTFVVRTALIAIVVVLLVAIFFVLRDYRRKRHYLRMYEALQKNQAQLVTAQELSEEEPEKQPLTREEVIALYRDNFALCNERFQVSAWPQRLEKMSASIHADALMLGADERGRLSKALDECFIQVNVNLRSEGRLTNDDVRCCLLAMLGCPFTVIGACLGSSPEAVQTRKSRLKDKLPRDVFDWVFTKN
ncbi:MAG: hypothetical protein IKJ09_01510 [Bacteroidaceae bacterium]|nr:hypothetical protein [Bacteroidaceae bacterium]